MTKQVNKLINMKSTQPQPDVIFTIPDNLPIPLDDGACDHLENMMLPDVSLWSTIDEVVTLSELPSWNVIFCYPMTGRPGVSIPDNWVNIPGAAGCTPQTCSYRDYYMELKNKDVGVYGISSQTSEAQKEASDRLGLPYPLLSDSDHYFSSALRLPTFEINSAILIKRLTFIIRDGFIEKCFYPVFPPDKNVIEVISWLSENKK